MEVPRRLSCVFVCRTTSRTEAGQGSTGSQAIPEAVPTHHAQPLRALHSRGPRSRPTQPPSDHAALATTGCQLLVSFDTASTVRSDLVLLTSNEDPPAGIEKRSRERQKLFA